MYWTMEDIPWDRFDASRVDPHILLVVKAAAMVERNAADYAAYLANVFHDDADFRAKTDLWRREEEQHGDALGRWAEMADPTFRYEEAFEAFRDAYHIPTDLTESVRGSRTGELIARCIVETGTSSFYSALRDAADEPVLKAICHKIAGDEFRHYKMFYSGMKRYQATESIPAWRRFLIAVGRIRETEDDELATAYWVANLAPGGAAYDRKVANLNYAARAFSLYRPRHVQRAVNMTMKAAGLSAQGRVAETAQKALWFYIRSKAKRLESELAAVNANTNDGGGRAAAA